MGMMAILAAGSLALSAVTAFTGTQRARANAEAEADAAAQEFALQQTELTRQQREAQGIAQEERSDVVRRANQELGTLRAMTGEMGASPNAFARMVAELGGAEGIDLARINRNRDNRVSALQASKDSSSQQYTNRATAAYNQGKSQITSSVLGFVGSGLQIGAGYQARQQDLEIARNQRIQ